ncbi:MAG: pyridoxal-phosphate dependent enzyme [Thermoplasmatales archaeon]|jgi:threonine synthase
MEKSHEVLGNTPLISAKNLGKELGIERLYLKYEGSNPTGTQKDRVASVHVQKALEYGYDTVVVGSCGNYGAAIAYYASLHHLKSLIYIPRQFHSPRLEEIQYKYGARLMLVDGMYEDSVEASKRDASDNNWFDANAGAHPELGLEAYAPIALELFQVIGEVADTVSVPVGNGTTLAGIYHGFEKMKISGLVKKVPKMIAASTDGGNPVISSFKGRLAKIADFPRNRIRETEINEPLVNYHSYDGDLAYEAVLKSKGYAEYVTDEELLSFKKLVRDMENLDAIPAAVASLVGTYHVVGRKNDKGIHVAVLTG